MPVHQYQYIWVEHPCNLLSDLIPQPDPDRKYVKIKMLLYTKHTCSTLHTSPGLNTSGFLSSIPCLPRHTHPNREQGGMFLTPTAMRKHSSPYLLTPGNLAVKDNDALPNPEEYSGIRSTIPSMGGTAPTLLSRHHSFTAVALKIIRD